MQRAQFSIVTERTRRFLYPYLSTDSVAILQTETAHGA